MRTRALLKITVNHAIDQKVFFFCHERLKESQCSDNQILSKPKEFIFLECNNVLRSVHLKLKGI